MELYFNPIALGIIFGYYALINIILYIVMVVDKRKSQKNSWRIPEKYMYILSVLGGGLGGLIAMVFKRHKNRHMDFILVFTTTAILHMVAAFLLVGKFAFYAN